MVRSTLYASARACLGVCVCARAHRGMVLASLFFASRAPSFSRSFEQRPRCLHLPRPVMASLALSLCTSAALSISSRGERGGRGLGRAVVKQAVRHDTAQPEEVHRDRRRQRGTREDHKHKPKRCAQDQSSSRGLLSSAARSHTRP